MPHDTEPDKESYQAQMPSSDRFRLRRQDNVVKGKLEFFQASGKNKELPQNSTKGVKKRNR